jgi:integrase
MEHFGTRTLKIQGQGREFIEFLADEGYSRRTIGATLHVGYGAVRRVLADRQEASYGQQERTADGLRLHQARHTYASFMIAAGVNAKALSTFMGHSSIKVTFDLYGHLMPGTEAEAAALLDTYLGVQVDAGSRTTRAVTAA